MKTLILLALFISNAAFAERTTVNGTGTSYSMCNGSNYQFCVMQIKRNAEYQAENDLRSLCSMRGGRIVSVPYCGYQFCNPNWMQPNEPDQMVSCRADCSATCEN